MATEFNPGGAASLNEAVKTRYETNSNTNAFTDAEQAKLGTMAAAKLDATAAPTANDDASNTSGNGTFAAGSLWVDVTNGLTYRCVDATATAAVWAQMIALEPGQSLTNGDLLAANANGNVVGEGGADFTRTGDTTILMTAGVGGRTVDYLLKWDGNGNAVESSPANARALLDLEVGTDVQAYSAILDATTASFTTADEAKLDGVEAGAEVNTIDSDPAGVTGADQVTNVMSLTTAEYGAITPNATTLYLITDAT